MKKISHVLAVFFLLLQLVPFVLLGSKAAAAKEAVTIEFLGEKPKNIGDQGEIEVSHPAGRSVKLTVEPKDGIEIEERESKPEKTKYHYIVKESGSYQLYGQTTEEQPLESEKQEVIISEQKQAREASVEDTQLEQGAQEVTAQSEESDTSAEVPAGTESTTEAMTEATTEPTKEPVAGAESQTTSAVGTTDASKAADAKGTAIRPLPEADQSKLGDIWDYNAVVTGEHSANMADTEGPIAVFGNSSFPDDLQTFTYGASFRQENTTIGDPLSPSQYVNVLLGGRIYNFATQEWVNPIVENRTENGETRGWLVGRTTMEQWIYKELGEWFSAIAYKAEDSLLDSQFAHLSSQEANIQQSLDSLVSEGQVIEETSSYKIYQSAQDPTILYLNLKADSSGVLNIGTLEIPQYIFDEETYRQIVVTSDAAKVVFSKTSIAGISRGSGYEAISKYAHMLSYYFPKADSVTNYLEDDGSYPTLTAEGVDLTSGSDLYGKDNGSNYFHSFTIGSVIAPNATVVYHSGSINGYVFVKNLHQRDGMEIHNFNNNWIPEGEKPVELGQVAIKKVDSETGAALRDAQFGIRRQGETDFVQLAETNEQGEAVFVNLPYGSYEVLETRAPEGYELSAEIQTVTVSEEEQTLQLTFKDQKTATTGQLLVQKTDKETGQALAGATIGVRPLRSSEFMEKVTNASGEAEFADLAYGYYQVRELKAPEGYQLDETTHVVQVLQNDEGKTVFTLVNEKQAVLGSITLKKTDKDSGTPLAGVTFGVRQLGQREFITAETDAAGQVTFDQLASGYYEIAELRTLAGYQLLTGTIKAEITEAEQHVDLGTITNQKKAVEPGQLRLIKTDKETGQTLSGAEFGIRLLGQLTYRRAVTNDKGEILFTGLTPGTYEVREFTPPTGYESSQLVRKVTVQPGSEGEVELSWSNQKKTEEVHGSLKISKVDVETGRPLKGATFKIRNNHEQAFTESSITNDNGEAYFEELPLGEYDVIETQAPAGYEVDKTHYHAFLTSETASIETTVIPNKQLALTGNLTLKKTDKETQELLSGAVFMLKNLATGEEQQETTDKEGQIHWLGLPVGAYEYWEIQAPTGYELDKTHHRVEITQDNTEEQPLLITVENQKQVKPVEGSVVLKKIDRETGAALAGVEFGIRPLGQKEFQKAKTNDSGELTFAHLALGFYEIAETQPLPGYLGLKEIQKVEITEQQQRINLGSLENSKENQVGKLSIKKVDKETAAALAGAVFRLTRVDDGSFYQEQTSNQEGEAVFSDLPFGQYQLREVKAPEGYLLSNQVIDVTVSQEEKEHTLTFDNQKGNEPELVGNVQLTKYDGTSKAPLAGVVFELQDDAGAAIGQYTTDQKGQLSIEKLALGSYRLVEIQALPGYELSGEAIPFEVTEENAGQWLYVTKANYLVPEEKPDQPDGGGTTDSSGGNHSSTNGKTPGNYPSMGELVSSNGGILGAGLLLLVAVVWYWRKKKNASTKHIEK